MQWIIYITFDDIKYDAFDEQRAKSCNILYHLKVVCINETYLSSPQPNDIT